MPCPDFTISGSSWKCIKKVAGTSVSFAEETARCEGVEMLQEWKTRLLQLGINAGC